MVVLLQKLMNNKILDCFTSMKPVMPAVTERYEIRNTSFHTPTIKHKFTECSFCKKIVTVLQM